MSSGKQIDFNNLPSKRGSQMRPYFMRGINGDSDCCSADLVGQARQKCCQSPSRRLTTQSGSKSSVMINQQVLAPRKLTCISSCPCKASPANKHVQHGRPRKQLQISAAVNENCARTSQLTCMPSTTRSRLAQPKRKILPTAGQEKIPKKSVATTKLQSTAIDLKKKTSEPAQLLVNKNVVAPKETNELPTSDVRVCVCRYKGACTRKLSEKNIPRTSKKDENVPAEELQYQQKQKSQSVNAIAAAQEWLQRDELPAPREAKTNFRPKNPTKAMLGYDFIAGLLDNEQEISPSFYDDDTFFMKLEKFRKTHWKECHAAAGPAHRSRDRSNQPTHTSTGKEALSDDHICTHVYRVNERLYAAPTLETAKGECRCAKCGIVSDKNTKEICVHVPLKVLEESLSTDERTALEKSISKCNTLPKTVTPTDRIQMNNNVRERLKKRTVLCYDSMALRHHIRQ